MLTLICVPAGYAKTTLLTEWISSMPSHDGLASTRDRPPDCPSFCWLAPDETDNDLARFLSYLPASPAPRKARRVRCGRLCSARMASWE